MTRETQWAIGILVAGILGAGVYWFWPAAVDDDPAATLRTIREKIILPQYDPTVYRDNEQVQAYLHDLRAMIRRGEAVLPLPKHALDRNGRTAQAIVLRDPKFLQDTHYGKKLYHNDMMRIVPAPVAALNAAAHKVCASHTCYQAEKYNFVTNATTRAIVDVDAAKVLSVDYFPGTQPDISHRLKKIAEAIALNAPEIRKELGHTPRENEITMANVRGSMKESPCENTNHLCVAPTFADTQRGRALWAVVDLTQMRLAAAKWAGLGKTTTPACIAERTLENRYIMEHFCQKDSVLDRDGWHIVYRLTASDGLEVRDVTFRGRPVLHSAKIVDWHVAYQQEQGGDELNTSAETYIEGRRVEYVRGENGRFMFGYNDAMGCPMFSTSVVLAFNGPQIKPLRSQNGFMLTQDFRNPKWPMACNYRYENRFEFYHDGSFRVVAANKGRGCGDTAVYRPVMRIDLAVDARERFYRHDRTWVLWQNEYNASVPVPPSGADDFYPYKITAASNPTQGFYLEPNYGQFGDHSRGDHARLYVTRFAAAEGDRDMLTLGSCCRLDHDGPETFLNHEPIDGAHIVLWYVPRIHNDDRPGHEYCWADTRIGADGNPDVRVWPCTVGPKFVPISPN